MRSAFFFIFSFLSTLLWAQGPYAPGVGIHGTTAMHKDSSAFVGWATHCEVNRGWQDIAQKNMGKTSVGDSTSTLGPADNMVLSLGDSGVAILQFDRYIFDGPGPDFAVFENGFIDQRNNEDFLELAFVEVSSDGKNFYRFPAHSLTDTSTAVGSFGTIDPTTINNLAGKYYAQYGTPFDLAELKGIPGLDIQKITHIKIIDVVGSLDNEWASRDTANRKINDPYPTAFPSGGFDLDAVGAIHMGATVGLSKQKISPQLQLYPNPTEKEVFFPAEWENSAVKVFSLDGRLVFSEDKVGDSINLENFKAGMYIISLVKEGKQATVKILLK